jgi:uroporphyrinogen decarboxylase
MNHIERIESCLGKFKVDRLPVALWRHFPVDDQAPDRLARAIISFQNTYDFDFIKVTPASSFCLKDWGVEDEWCGSREGTREYRRYIIGSPEDWRKLPILDPYKGSLNEQLTCLSILNKEFSNRVPYIQTIFNPLSQAKNLIGGDQLLVHLRQFPDALIEGLEIITESTIKFIESIQKTGIAGIFFAVQHASYSLLSMDEYDRFGREFDLRILEAAKDLWLNVLHLHGDNIMFNQFLDYPVQVINWHDRETSLNLFQGSKIFRCIVCGGLSRVKSLILGTPESILTEAEDAIRSMGDTSFILGTGCVVPIIYPHANMEAARMSVDKFRTDL